MRAVWRACLAFADGAFPLVGWQTEHRLPFGLAWLVISLTVLLPAYLGAIGLSVLAIREARSEVPDHRDNPWPGAILISVLLVLLTFCARVAVTAWFPEELHPPLHSLNGGLLTGLVVTVLSGLTFAVTLKVAALISPHERRSRDELCA